MKKQLLIMIVLLIVVTACSRNKLRDVMSPEENMAKGNEFFEKKKYNKAIPFYERVVLDLKSQYTAQAQLRLADSYMNRKDYFNARLEYEEFLKFFPENREAARAQFNIGVCYFNTSLAPQYTQEETIEAIEAFETYLQKYPTHGLRLEAVQYIEKCNYKLLAKTYENGYIYYKIYDYSSALMYFDRIIELNISDELDRKSLYYSGLISYKRKEKEKTGNYLEILTNKYPDSKETAKMKKYYSRLK